MSDLGGPYPVSVETTHDREEATHLLERGLRRFGIDVIEANASLLKGLSPPPPNQRWCAWFDGSPDTPPAWRWSKCGWSRRGTSAG